MLSAAQAAQKMRETIRTLPLLALRRTGGSEISSMYQAWDGAALRRTGGSENKNAQRILCVHALRRTGGSEKS